MTFETGQNVSQIVHLTQWSSDSRISSAPSTSSPSWIAIRQLLAVAAGAPARDGRGEHQLGRAVPGRQAEPVARLLPPRLGAGQRRAGDEHVLEHALAGRVDRAQVARRPPRPARPIGCGVEVAGAEALLARRRARRSTGSPSAVSRAAQRESSSSPPEAKPPVASTTQSAPRRSSRSPTRTRSARHARAVALGADDHVVEHARCPPARRSASRRIANSAHPGHRRRQRRAPRTRGRPSPCSSAVQTAVRVGDPEHRRERDALARPQPRARPAPRPGRGTPGSSKRAGEAERVRRRARPSGTRSSSTRARLDPRVRAARGCRRAARGGSP